MGPTANPRDMPTGQVEPHNRQGPHDKEGQHHELADESSVLYRRLDVLGRGGSATVDKPVEHIESRKVYARKTFFVLPSNRKRWKHEFEHELRIIRRLGNHHHFVRLESYRTKNSFALVLEPAVNRGTLDTFLEDFKLVDELTTRATTAGIIFQAFGCLASGLAFMHKHKIRHRDIKPENILVHHGAMIYTDFGISRDYSDLNTSVTEGRPDRYTPRYCAPEVKAWDARTWSLDVFSLGCVFILMYTAVFPNKTIEEVAKSIFHEHLESVAVALESFEEEPEVLPSMKAMLRYEEQERLGAADVVQILSSREARYFCGACRGESDSSETYCIQPSISLHAETKTGIHDSNMSLLDLSTAKSHNSKILMEAGDCFRLQDRVTLSRVAWESTDIETSDALELSAQRISPGAMVPYKDCITQFYLLIILYAGLSSLGVESLSSPYNAVTGVIKSLAVLLILFRCTLLYYKISRIL